MKDHYEIKQILDNVQVRNVAIRLKNILYYKNNINEVFSKECREWQILDEKIRLALVNDIFAELKMAFGIED